MAKTQKISSRLVDLNEKFSRFSKKALYLTSSSLAMCKIAAYFSDTWLNFRFLRNRDMLDDCREILLRGPAKHWHVSRDIRTLNHTADAMPPKKGVMSCPISSDFWAELLPSAFVFVATIIRGISRTRGNGKVGSVFELLGSTAASSPRAPDSSNAEPALIKMMNSKMWAPNCN